MRRGYLAGFIAVLILAGPTGVLAQTPEEKAIAKRRYMVGEKLYEISQYKKALVEFEEAYSLWPKHDMLYNIARCHEVLGNLGKAIETYKLFMEKRPDSPHITLVKTRIKSLEERQAEKKAEKVKAAKTVVAAKEAKAEKPKPATKVATERPTAEEAKAVTAKAKPEAEKTAKTPIPIVAPAQEEPAPVKAGRTWRWTAGWAGVGVGGAALVTGIAFGALAAGKSSDFEEQRDNGGTYRSLKELKDSGEQYETLQIALMAGGGVIVAAGGALLIWELFGGEENANSDSATFTPVVTKHGVGFTTSLSF